MSNNQFLTSATISIILTLGLATRSLATPSVVKETSTSISSTLRAEQPRPIQQSTPMRGRVVFNPQGTLAPTAFPSQNLIGDRRRSEEGCPNGSVFLTALLPFAEVGRIRTASTIAARPTFFVYIPPYRAKVAEFWLSDDQHNVLYHTTFVPPNQPGVIGIRLPLEVPELEVDRFYHWGMGVSCDPNDRISGMGVESWVQRRKLPSSLETMLNQTPLRDRPAFFARQGLWHDALLLTLAQLRLANPQDQRLQDDWSSLLTSVDLQPIAQEPLLRIETLPMSTADSP
jgi:Domain of Unknown Function (DUF928)